MRNFRKIAALAVMMALLLSGLSALADQVTRLPEGVETIDENAFSGSTVSQSIVSILTP